MEITTFSDFGCPGFEALVCINHADDVLTAAMEIIRFIEVPVHDLCRVSGVKRSRTMVVCRPSGQATTNLNEDGSGGQNGCRLQLSIMKGEKRGVRCFVLLHPYSFEHF